MKMNCQLDYELIATQQGREVNLLIGLKAPVAEATKRKPMNLGLVIDRSGSMQGEKLQQTKAAIKLLVRHLGPEDRVSLVIFDNEVSTIREAIPVEDRTELYRQVDRIRPRGMTNLSGGWLKGIEHVAAQASEKTINRIMLLTDGLANEGIRDPDQLASIGREAREKYGIVTTTLGFGEGFNEDLLVRIADESGGNFYYIETADMAPEIFQEELGDLMQLVAQNIEVTIRPRDPVTLVTQWTDHRFQVLEDGARYQLGDAYSGESKNLLLALSVPDLAELGPMVIAETEVRFTEILADKVQMRSITQNVSVNLTEESAAAAEDPKAQVVHELGMQISARARKDAMREADKGGFEQAKETLKNAADKLCSLGLDHPALVQEQANLESQSREIEEHSYRKMRKYMRAEAHSIGKGKMDKLAKLRERKEHWGKG